MEFRDQYRRVDSRHVLASDAAAARAAVAAAAAEDSRWRRTRRWQGKAEILPANFPHLTSPTIKTISEKIPTFEAYQYPRGNNEIEDGSKNVEQYFFFLSKEQKSKDKKKKSAVRAKYILSHISFVTTLKRNSNMIGFEPSLLTRVFLVMVHFSEAV